MAIVPSGVRFNPETKALIVNDEAVDIYYFDDNPTMPWFKAKPVHNRLGAKNIGHTLKRVSNGRKSTLRELIATKGRPIHDVAFDVTLLNQNDLNSIFVNEPGLYDILLGSQKEEAVIFRDWVTGTVLPALRTTGTYSIGDAAVSSSTERQIALLEAEESRKNAKHAADMQKHDEDMQAPRDDERARQKAELKQRRSRPPVALGESTLSWTIELGVERKELRGVKAVFQGLLEIEVSAGALAPIDKSTLRRFMSAPPRRFEELARAALKQFRQRLRTRLDTVAVTGPSASSAKRKQPHRHHCSSRHDDSASSSSDTDILKVSDVMEAAGVWKPVAPIYMPDLAMRMHQLKCEENPEFSARRRRPTATVVAVAAHKYSRATDWPLAERAVRETRDVYQKRVREMLDEALRMATDQGVHVADHPEVVSSRVAVGLALGLKATNLSGGSP